MDLDQITSIASTVPTDWMIIGAFAIFAAFDALRSGARRASSLALALPAAFFLFTLLPKTTILGAFAEQFATPILEAILFLILFTLMYVLVNRIGLSWGGEAGMTIQAALAGVAATAILVVFWIQIPALAALYNFGADVKNIFGETYAFFWLIGSYAALAFVRNS